MRPNAAQIVLALAAAIAFVLAFMAAGAVLLSGLFMVLGLAAIAWLALSLIKGVLHRERKPEPRIRA